ncbi:hypothetical protein ACSVDE_09180 [Pseudalkalibacillus sp. Hm43]|uniref:hypothetical protein n=1 Tax=Pseudalkalibacillus sp. Hm43 TaxID=3450742 RepID=UPI003F444AA6
MKNTLVIFLFLIGLTLSGCSNNGLDGERPPEAFVKVGSETFRTILGTYCWKGKGKGICVDTVGPKEILKGKEPIPVKQGEEINLVINFEPKPNEFHVLQINENDEEIEVSVKNNSFNVPLQRGVYYYSYGVWWMDEKVEHLSHGDAFYNFVIKVE